MRTCTYVCCSQKELVGRESRLSALLQCTCTQHVRAGYNLKNNRYNTNRDLRGNRSLLIVTNLQLALQQVEVTSHDDGVSLLSAQQDKSFC